MPPFHRRQTELSPLSERVKDAAVEVAREVPVLAREGQERVVGVAREVAREAPVRARELRSVVENLDIPWARSAPARWLRENFMRFVMNQILDYYAARRSTGFESLADVRDPVIFVANHASHIDTPVILSALPRRMRRHTAVAAAADYFYRNRLVAWLVSLLFNTVPIERRSGGGKSMGHLDTLLDEGWNLLLYPQGTRKHADGDGRVRRGAAVLAARHNLSIVPIHVTGTAQAMPPGAIWPKRLRGRLHSRRHRIEVAFGPPIAPLEDVADLIEQVQAFFESSEHAVATGSERRRRPWRRGG